MTDPAAAATATTGGGMLVVAVVLPLVGILLSLLLGARHAERIAMLTLAALLGVAAVIFAQIWHSGHSLIYIVAWNPPLGIALRADGLSAAMMMTAAVVMCAIALFARADFGTPPDLIEARAPFAFWILMPGVAGAMNLVCLGGDLFTLYVALELLTFAAVPLVSLDGRAETLQAALRYLLFAVSGSVLYLLGAGLLYGAYGMLDIAMLSRGLRADFVTILAAALMTAGLLAKTALFPLHLWLPPAHAGAPAAASAALSALVVKGSFFVVIRLWFDVMPTLPGPTGAQLLGALGAAAIVFGGAMALRQHRLKLLVAYSTVAQIGYLFLLFPLAFGPASTHLEGGLALAGGMLQAISHAMAKAAMFMAAGLIYAGLGHDRIAGLAGAGRALPVTMLAFACSGLCLIGLPPGGAFLAKAMLMQSPAAATQWWWDWIMSVGSVLTSAYVFAILLRMLAPASTSLALRTKVPPARQLVALALAFCSLLLTFVAFNALDILQIGRAELPAVLGLDDLFAPSALAKAFVPAIVGGLLAVGMLRQQDRAGRQEELKDASLVLPAMAASARPGPFDRLDRTLGRWPVGSASMLFLALALGAAMIAAR